MGRRLVSGSLLRDRPFVTVKRQSHGQGQKKFSPLFFRNLSEFFTKERYFCLQPNRQPP
jgi:hypothetical protein